MTGFQVETGEEPEKAILVGVDRDDPDWPMEESLAELERLAETAGCTVVATLSQRLLSPNPKTFVGPGKADEISRIAQHLEADVVIFDDELTPSQQNNIETLVGKGIKVIDRTALILDIFALHATTREGRLQVQLAQSQYLYPRLRGMWAHLASNRMGGGVGSRFGEGESQLEVDRRLVRKRISKIRSELKEVSTTRATQRKARKRSGVFRIALAGYTNAGKSTLINRLTDSDVLAYDKLFATLDSTTRRLSLPEGHEVTITDTVGFIQKLPHTLVEAFQSTLEEVSEADLILQVTDAGALQRDAQVKAVRNVLGQIGAERIETLHVFNKIDLIDEYELNHLKDLHPDAICVSAVDGRGADELISAITKAVDTNCPAVEVLIPFTEGRLVQVAHEKATVIGEDYSEEGTLIKMKVPKAIIPAFDGYYVGDSARFNYVEPEY